MLMVGVHAFKSKYLHAQLEAFWICEEMANHKQYSSLLLEVHMAKDFLQHFKSFMSLAIGLLLCGITLCASAHFLLQSFGVMFCLLSTTAFYNLFLNQLNRQYF